MTHEKGLQIFQEPGCAAHIANPIGQIWAAAMMLDHLGAVEAGQAIVAAIEQVLSEDALRTPDLGGPADTRTCGAAIADAVLETP